MSDDGPVTTGVLGSLRVVSSGRGAVRLQDRFDTDIDDLWSALTDPARLARWLGQVDGDLVVGGRFRAYFLASGWEGSGRVVACEQPRHFLLATQEAGEPDEHEVEVTLTADGRQTVLVVEERGMPRDQLAGYGAGTHIHVEDLAAYLEGRGRCEARLRFDELFPAYQDLATTVD
ncbi:SRPBCC family protein [uncultured Jatrophihabitans sp.]|uniref:SRPBCC family protein n=1 Tax=uncultured Jatrophihabitans sp. TaxID=1610747 RepID=UPI0035CB38BC